MASHLLAVTFDAQHPLRVAAFWADMLGRDVIETDEGALLPADGPEVGLGFARCPTKKTEANRAHLRLTSTSDADQQHTVDRGPSPRRLPPGCGAAPRGGAGGPC